MDYLQKGILTILFINILIISSACAPGRVLTRDNDIYNDDQVFSQEDDYSFNDETNDNKDGIDNERMSGSNKKGNGYLSEDFSRDSRNRDNHDSWESDEDKYTQKGLASWYGREFQGSITASGERFDMNKMTAAHRKLPFGTRLLVKNFDNGKSVKVVINDRGPYRDGRILDLSFSAAKKLNMIKDGETNVGIMVLRKAKNEDRNRREYSTEAVSGDSFENDEFAEDDLDEYLDKDSYTSDEPDGRFSVQAGAFYSRKNARKLKRQIGDLTENPVVVIREDYMYKIRIKGMKSKNQAKRFKNILNEEDISSFIIKD